MASLKDLLKYKSEVEIKAPTTDKVLAKVWVRTIGDDDLNTSFKLARIASSNRRKKLSGRQYSLTLGKEYLSLTKP